MPLPVELQQTIDRIVAETPDITPELEQPLRDELLEQYEDTLIKLISQHLGMEQTAKFQAMIHSAPQQERLQQLLTSLPINLKSIQADAITWLQTMYLDNKSS